MAVLLDPLPELGDEALAEGTPPLLPGGGGGAE
jgi:hypothetical protein